MWLGALILIPASGHTSQKAERLGDVRESPLSGMAVTGSWQPGCQRAPPMGTGPHGAVLGMSVFLVQRWTARSLSLLVGTDLRRTFWVSPKPGSQRSLALLVAVLGCGWVLMWSWLFWGLPLLWGSADRVDPSALGLWWPQQSVLPA